MCVHPETRKRRIKLIEYDDECVDFIKGIRGRKYYHDTKEWEIDVKYTQECKDKIDKLNIKIFYFFKWKKGFILIQ